jgi:hypothetical protein
MKYCSYNEIMLMKKKRIILKKIQLVLAQTQVPPIFPFSPKNSHFQKLNFEK